MKRFKICRGCNRRLVGKDEDGDWLDTEDEYYCEELDDGHEPIDDWWLYETPHSVHQAPLSMAEIQIRIKYGDPCPCCGAEWIVSERGVKSMAHGPGCPVDNTDGDEP